MSKKARQTKNPLKIKPDAQLALQWAYETWLFSLLNTLKKNKKLVRPTPQEIVQANKECPP